MLVTKSDLEQVLGETLARGGDFAEIFLERRRSSTVGLEAARVEKVHSGLDQGAGIRLLAKDTSIYVYTNDISLPGLMKAAATAATALKQKRSDPTVVPLTTPKLDSKDGVDNRVDIEDQVKLVQIADKEARTAGDKIKQVLVRYGNLVQDVQIANSLGKMVMDHRNRHTMIVHVVAAEGNIVQTGYESLGTCNDIFLFTPEQAQKLAAMATRRALMLVGARPAPAGRMPVVLAGEAGGTMIHEACGHGLEADIVGKEMSVYAGKIGQQVASELVTVVDDPTLPGKYGSYAYDDEGTPAEKTVLIRNGVLETYMYDLEWARRQGESSTSNGRRQSFQFRPIPRMSNTYLAAGETAPEEIIAQTKYGLLVKRMGGGQVNPTTGDFVFDIAEGYLIEQGQVTNMVRGATLSGNGPEVLLSVDLVGTDLGFGIGTCGKDGQGVPVSDAQPTIRIPELIVGGLL
ncbi:MAG: TldD/PmbA family protein [Firmicutes bacterium]|nr:TldD/PmbA family protein [Bacillota bacterium]